MVRTKTDFHIIQSVLITKLRTKSSQSVAEFDYRIDTGSDSNQIPVSMIKMLFPRMPIKDRDKYINKR